MPEPFCIRMCPSVSVSVRPENLVNNISQKPMVRNGENFTQCWSHNVFGFIYVLIFGATGSQQAEAAARRVPSSTLGVPGLVIYTMDTSSRCFLPLPRSLPISSFTAVSETNELHYYLIMR